MYVRGAARRRKGLGETSWAQAISTAIKGATDIFAARWAVPQLAPGTTYQTGPGGTAMQSVYPYQAQLALTGTGGLGNMLLIGVAVIAGIVVITQVGKR